MITYVQSMVFRGNAAEDYSPADHFPLFWSGSFVGGEAAGSGAHLLLLSPEKDLFNRGRRTMLPVETGRPAAVSCPP